MGRRTRQKNDRSLYPMQMRPRPSRPGIGSAASNRKARHPAWADKRGKNHTNLTDVLDSSADRSASKSSNAEGARIARSSRIAEVEYHEREDTAVYLKFPIATGELARKGSTVISTTTPRTRRANPRDRHAPEGTLLHRRVQRVELPYRRECLRSNHGNGRGRTRLTNCQERCWKTAAILRDA